MKIHPIAAYLTKIIPEKWEADNDETFFFAFPIDEENESIFLDIKINKEQYTALKSIHEEVCEDQVLDIMKEEIEAERHERRLKAHRDKNYGG